MTTLRRRFLLTTALLVGLQLASTGLALLSWRRVLVTAENEHALAAWRAEVMAFGDAVREQYVHQAHTFIEGTDSHLDHYPPAEQSARQRLSRLAGLPVPEREQVLAALQSDYEAFSGAFRQEVIPRVIEGRLERAEAARLHESADRLASRVDRDVTGLVQAVDRLQAEQRARAQQAVLQASVALAAVALGGAGLLLLITRQLAGAVLEPVHALREAAARFGAGETTARARVSGDDEMGQLARAFNQMVGQVTRAEERRVRAERLAALGELSAAVAHELLNPLAVIVGHAAGRPEPEWQTVRLEADHARKVMQGLLGFARPGEDAPMMVALGTLVREATERLGPAADARDVSLEAQVAEVEPVVVSPSGVRQVLDNLLRNAIQASPPGSRVRIELSPGPVVRILDRGEGVPEAIRRRLYEPFTTGRPGGTGLGLAVSSRIVRAQGGQLLHEDRPGGGTIFTWRLGVADG